MGEVKQTFVVATDFSDDAACAVGWTREIALQHGARVALVHAFVADALPAPEFVPLPPQYYEQIHAEAMQRLEAEAAKGADLPLSVWLGLGRAGVVKPGGS